MENQRVVKFMQFLEDELKKQKIKGTEFYKKTGITTMTLWYWLNGRSQMTLKNYYKVLDILGYEETLSKIKKDETNGK